MCRTFGTSFLMTGIPIYFVELWKSGGGMMNFLKKLFSQENKQFFSSVAGVSKKNVDGTKRQDIINKLRNGEKLILEPESDNPHDKNAVKVLTTSGKQIGYLNQSLAYDISPKLKYGDKVNVSIKEITGGTKDKPTLGVNIQVTIIAS